MTFDEETIAARLRDLPPAPDAWVAAAAEIPRIRHALASLEQVIREAPDRAAHSERLERALADAGLEPTRALVAALWREIDR